MAACGNGLVIFMVFYNGATIFSGDNFLKIFYNKINYNSVLNCPNRYCIHNYTLQVWNHSGGKLRISICAPISFDKIVLYSISVWLYFDELWFFMLYTGWRGVGVIILIIAKLGNFDFGNYRYVH